LDNAGFDDVDDADADDAAVDDDNDDEDEIDEWLFCTDYVSGKNKEIVLTPPKKDQTDAIELENKENDSSDSDEDN
jgi:hypothetical protein